MEIKLRKVMIRFNFKLLLNILLVFWVGSAFAEHSIEKNPWYEHFKREFDNLKKHNQALIEQGKGEDAVYFFSYTPFEEIDLDEDPCGSIPEGGWEYNLQANSNGATFLENATCSELKCRLLGFNNVGDYQSSSACSDANITPSNLNPKNIKIYAFVINYYGAELMNKEALKSKRMKEYVTIQGDYKKYSSIDTTIFNAAKEKNSKDGDLLLYIRRYQVYYGKKEMSAGRFGVFRLGNIARGPYLSTTRPCLKIYETSMYGSRPNHAPPKLQHINSIPLFYNKVLSAIEFYGNPDEHTENCNLCSESVLAFIDSLKEKSAIDFVLERCANFEDNEGIKNLVFQTALILDEMGPWAREFLEGQDERALEDIYDFPGNIQDYENFINDIGEFHTAKEFFWSKKDELLNPDQGEEEQSAMKLYFMLLQFTDEDYEKLTIEDRRKIIELYLDDHLTGNWIFRGEKEKLEENIAIKLIGKVNKNDCDYVRTWLEELKSINNFVKYLFENIDDTYFGESNLTKVINEINELVFLCNDAFKNSENGDGDPQIILQDSSGIKEQNVFIYDPPSELTRSRDDSHVYFHDRIRYVGYEIDPAGKITVHYKVAINDCYTMGSIGCEISDYVDKSIEYDAFDPIIFKSLEKIYFLDHCNGSNNNCQNVDLIGSGLFIPYVLATKEREDAEDAIENAINVAFITMGVWEVASAKTALGILWGVGEVVLGAGDLFMNDDEVQNKLNKTEQGRNFKKCWDIFQLAYVFGSGVRGIKYLVDPGDAARLVAAKQNADDIGALNDLEGVEGYDDMLATINRWEEELRRKDEWHHLIQEAKDIFNNIGPKLSDKLDELFDQDLEIWKKLLDDLGKNNDLISIFEDNIEWVKAWDILFKEGDAISQALRTDPKNLEKLSRYIEVEGVDIVKLKSSFANTKDAQKWIDLKLPKSDLDNIYAGFKNDPPFNHTPWTPEHKAQRWKNYEEGCANGQNACLDFESWSNGYDGKIDLVTNANKAVDDYFNSLGWNCPASTCRERTLSTTIDGQTLNRRLDIYDEVNLRGKEFKEYSSGKVYRSEDIRSEVARDKQLLEDGQLLEMEWVFKGCEPSGPLRTLLESSPNPITVVLIP